MNGRPPVAPTPDRTPTTAAWWSQRWLALLEEAGPSDARRIQRGQAAARRGAVEDLEIRPGAVTGRVREERARPYRVMLTWPVPDEEAWTAAVAALAAEVRSTAALLDGQLPEETGALLAGAGVPLVPTPTELGRSCTCDERSAWCRHIAAVHTAAGHVFGRDPFLLLRLRGRTRSDLLRSLRSGRSGDDELGVDLDPSAGMFEARGDLDAVPLSPHPVHDPGALLRQLGDPPGVDDPRPFAAIIERAAQTAWRLAAGAGAEAADEELLLAELRAQRVGSVPSLAAALGREEGDVRDHLDALFDAGTVLRTGSGDRTRYRAP